MVEGYYREVSALLREAGYERIAGGKGSHEKWQNSKTGHVVIVPRNLQSRHTANGILKDIGVRKKF